mgnify:CR=1 FL=1
MKFTALDPASVVVGRGRLAMTARQPYRAAILDGQAGRIDLDRGESITTCHALLGAAARELGIPIRSSKVEAERVIYWKRVGADTLSKPAQEAIAAAIADAEAGLAERSA